MARATHSKDSSIALPLYEDLRSADDATPPIAGMENRLRAEDRAAHDWYRFVLSYPPHLVRRYLGLFGVQPGDCVLDPFCGTGTTLVECKKLGIRSIGMEPNPMACFATRVKTDWSPDPTGLLRHAREVAAAATERLAAQGLPEVTGADAVGTRHPFQGTLRALSAEAAQLVLKDSISPVPLHRVMVLLDAIGEREDAEFTPHEELALARAVVYTISNLHFGPEVGVRGSRSDAPVVAKWLDGVAAMSRDLRDLAGQDGTDAIVHEADSRTLSGLLQPESVDAVITSPPYPNEKDYTRTTRLESVLLGFLGNKHDLRLLKQHLIRSNTRGVYKEDSDDAHVSDHAEIQRIADQIEDRRIALGKTSGFERLYSRVTKLYFGGMLRHLSELRRVLRPGAKLAYVVGDQASYLRVMIRTGQLLADIAQSLGYEVNGIDLFRTRLATATGDQLREEVVLLRWPSARP